MTETELHHEVRAASTATRAANGSGAARIAAPALNSEQLLGGGRAVTIEHEGAHYVLRATRNGKLILTK